MPRTRTAEARPDIDRRGFQIEVMFGVSACIPGRVECKREDSGDGKLVGKTGPSFGMGVTLGFRPIRSLMIGAAYNFGLFNPDYHRRGGDEYRRAYQNSLFAVIRGIIPVW